MAMVEPNRTVEPAARSSALEWLPALKWGMRDIDEVSYLPEQSRAAHSFWPEALYSI